MGYNTQVRWNQQTKGGRVENIPLKIVLAAYSARNKTRRWLQPMRFRLLNLRINFESKTRSFFHSLNPARVRLDQARKELFVVVKSLETRFQTTPEIPNDDPEVQSLEALTAEICTLESAIRGGSIHYYEP